MRTILAAVILATSASAAAAGDRLARYPEFALDKAQSAVVVARFHAPRNLPQFADCGDPDVICMDPAPFAMDATVLSTVHGNPVPGSIEVATTSHYGASSFERDAGPYLAWVVTDGRDYVLRRYAAAKLDADRLGQLHVVLRGEHLPWFLPCSIDGLKREIVDGDFPDGIEIPTAQMEDEGIAPGDSQYRMTATGAMPRWSIPVAALREHLAALPVDAPMACARTD
jgi:hypothetical protein